MTAIQRDVRWRAAGVYLPNNTSKTGLLEETRSFLLNYRRFHDAGAALRALVDGELPQRSRTTRQNIATVIGQRLLRWNPPTWVLDDLAQFAAETDPAPLKAALLLHVPRQDLLLYDLVQNLMLPRWQSGEFQIIRGDVQRFLDHGAPEHPEVETWSHGTREKLAGNLLTILRDYGLLTGTARKQIVEPIVPLPVAQHLARLLASEGIAASEAAQHPDWRLWLWGERRVTAALGELDNRKYWP